MYEEFIAFVKSIYNQKEFIALHEPKFIGNEKKYVNDCIDSTFVSSAGSYVNKFENDLSGYLARNQQEVDAKKIYVVATNSGTSALHICLLLAGVKANQEVITQPLTFVATCNAIKYCQADPVFVDVDKDTLGMSAKKLAKFFNNFTYQKDNQCINKVTEKVISACVPMHTFGNSCRIDEIIQLCKQHNVIVVEDAAESLGSSYSNKSLSLYGKLSAISFNGNKVITAGGGGAIITQDPDLAEQAKHLTTTAKVKHAWEYEHDQLGFNYRMPNLNAALLCAQVEMLDQFLEQKRKLYTTYKEFFQSCNYADIVVPIEGCLSNYWLNNIILEDSKYQQDFLINTNNAGVMTRPAWRLMTDLKIYSDCFKSNIDNAEYMVNRLISIPSGVI